MQYVIKESKFKYMNLRLCRSIGELHLKVVTLKKLVPERCLVCSNESIVQTSDPRYSDAERRSGRLWQRPPHEMDRQTAGAPKC